MRLQRLIASGFTLGALTLGLGACSGGDGDGETDTGQASGAAEELEGQVPDTGWWCRMIREETVAAATDGRADEAREVLRENDADSHLCEVVLPVDGGPQTETVMTFAIKAEAEEEAQQVRDEMASRDDVEAGPDYLGESYVVPGAAYSILPCGAPAESAKAGQQVTYLLSMTAQGEAGEQLDDELTEPLRRSLIELDQTVKCSPSDAAPPDDSSATTAP
jgi:hypothetical protein